MMMIVALKSKSLPKTLLLPAKNISKVNFKEQVKTGDLLLTCASNNFMSFIHSLFLETPVAHVGLAVRTQNKIFLFESGAPRGTQLRDLDDYMKEGSDYLWWRPLNVSEEKRSIILDVIEARAKFAYCWSFLRHIPREMLGIETVEGVEEGRKKSCADLVANVYTDSGIFTKIKRAWFPKHFLQELPSQVVLPPLNVVWIDKLRFD